MRSWLAGITSVLFIMGPQSAIAAPPPGGPPSPDNSAREFITSCTYGVLAGTLVGAASLAFVDKPGDNLSHVARGASLGLYAGILLGLYVVYIVPGLEDAGEEEPQIGKLDKIRWGVAPL